MRTISHTSIPIPTTTTTTPTTPAANNNNNNNVGHTNKQSVANKQQQANQSPQTRGALVQTNTNLSTSLTNSLNAHPFNSSSAAFQQVKQTQASLARLSRIHQQQTTVNNTNQSSHHHHHHHNNKHHHVIKEACTNQSQNALTKLQQQQTKSTTFVDCLIRRFKNCFSEDSCTVPMFVVGGLSPGSDGTHLILPPCVSLGRQNISRFSRPKNIRLMNSIRESCKSLEELDLGGNKLDDLIEIYKILQYTPNLRFLNLSENDLSRSSPVAMAANSTATTTTTTTSPYLLCPTTNTTTATTTTTTTATNNNTGQSSPNFRRTFKSIKALAMNNTGAQWRVVCSILSRMPNLEELHLSLNNYKRIDLDPNEFKHLSLKRLYLCNNPKLTDWQELDKLLVAFPSLEALSIADCNISQIPENLGRAREWRNVCGLNINGWPIKEWPVVERLNQLPSLIDLKCRNLEVLNSIDEPRHHLIARLPKLQRLNGSEIEEREHAEKAFLRFFITNSHLERPSRFHELVQIHGEIIPVEVDVDLSPPSKASVSVIYLDRNHYQKGNEDDIMMSEDFLTKLMETVEPSTIDVDLRQSVRKFKSRLASLFGLNSQNLILYYIDHEMFGLMGPELIKHNQKKLWNYNVQDGDQFIVEEI